MKTTERYYNITKLIEATKSAYEITSYYGQYISKLSVGPCRNYIAVDNKEYAAHNFHKSDVYIKNIIVSDSESEFIWFGPLSIDIHSHNVALGRVRSGEPYILVENIKNILAMALFGTNYKGQFPEWFDNKMFYEALVLDRYRLHNSRFYQAMYANSINTGGSSIINAIKNLSVASPVDEFYDRLVKHLNIVAFYNHLINIIKQLLTLHVGYYRDTSVVNSKSVIEESIFKQIRDNKLSTKVDIDLLKRSYSFMFSANFIEGLYFYRDYLPFYRFLKSGNKEKLNSSAILRKMDTEYYIVASFLDGLYEEFELDTCRLIDDMNDKQYLIDYIKKYHIRELSKEYGLDIKEVLGNCIEYIKLKDANKVSAFKDVKVVLNRVKE